jgi:ketosteroid isomerase-like protein
MSFYFLLFTFYFNSMKKFLPLLIFTITLSPVLSAQQTTSTDNNKKLIYSLIDQYSQAREKSDTVLLKSILTTDIDQLVSTGEWRDGVDASVKGMINSSATNAGTRTLSVEKLRFLNPNNAIVDCKYQIQNTDGTTRKMWSTFIVVFDQKKWKITAIRNMLPSER